MKTLLQINSVINYGSTGRIAEEISQTAIDNGWSSYIAYGRKERLSKSKLIKIGTDWDLIFHGLQTRLFDRHGLGSRKATKILIRQINKINPDIIHLHNLHGYYLNIDVLFKNLTNKNIPVIWTIHDCWPITGHCVYFDNIGCDKWKTECNCCPQKKSYPASFWLDRSAKNYLLKKKLFTSLHNLTIISVSNWLADLLNQSFLSEVPIRVINNGIDTSVFFLNVNSAIREKYNLKDKFIILGIANSWNSRKGLHDFIKLNKLLDDKFRILLIGLNPWQINRLPDNIIGVPRTENIQELVDYYNTSDVCLNTSVEETFGLTTIEAMACGTPSIVYNSTACPELISKDTGFVVEKGDFYGIIQAIKTIHKNGKNYYSDACINRAKRLYNKNELYSDYLNLYKSLIS